MPLLVACSTLADRQETALVVPVIGARTRERLAESLGALDVTLEAADLAAIESAVPADAAAGTRHASQQMAMLDSER
jgi:hypothetical protein